MYDIDRWIEKCIGMDLGDLLLFLNGVSNKYLLNGFPSKSPDLDKIKRYFHFNHEYLSFLRIGQHNMSKQDFKLTKPITEALLTRGQVGLGMLDFYE